MSANSDDDGSASKSRQAATFDFPAFLDRLRAAFATVQNSGARRDPAATLAAAKQLFDTYVSDNQPLTAGLQRGVEKVRRELENMEALTGGSLPGTASLFDPLVRLLLMLNYWHVVETAGRPAAKAELVAIVKGLTRRAKGRPAKITVRQAQEALRLRNQGVPNGQIARQLGLRDARTVLTVLKHHFPDEFLQKRKLADFPDPK